MVVGVIENYISIVVRTTIYQMHYGCKDLQCGRTTCTKKCFSLKIIEIIYLFIFLFFRIIIKRVYEEDLADNEGDTPLHTAAEQGYFDIFRLFMEKIQAILQTQEQ